MMTSPEFTRAYGEVETLTNEQFLDRVYQNVLDRNPDQAGFDFYLDLLDREVIDKARALSDIAISPENTLNSVDPLMSLFASSDGHWQFITDDGMSVA